MPLLNEIISVFNSIAPESLAQPWDNVGLQLAGSKNKINRMLLSLNASHHTVREAIDKKCEFLFTHHPLFFNGVKSLVSSRDQYDTGNERNEVENDQYDVVREAMINNITIYTAHTNLDKAKNGINAVLAEFLDLNDVQPLVADTEFKKLVFFSEVKHSRKIMEELALLGAGTIGRYSNASFRAPGIGTFKPEAGSIPSVGSKGVINEVDEERVEMIVHHSSLSAVLDRLFKVHPYEEVAYDVYSLEEIKKSDVGLGRIGMLDKALSVQKIADGIKKSLGSKVAYVGDASRKVKRIAVVAGAGAAYIMHAHSKKADLLITSDVKYHDAQEASDMGLNLIVTSHFAIEKFALKLLAPFMAEKLKKSGYSVEVMLSEKESDIWFENEIN